jgi:hypothetical protein
MERWIERSFSHLEDVFRELFDLFRDSLTVHAFAGGENAQDEEVQFAE